MWALGASLSLTCGLAEGLGISDFGFGIGGALSNPQFLFKRLRR